MADLLQNFGNFFDVLIEYVSGLYGMLINLTTGATMLFRMAYGFTFVAPALSAYFLAPIAISGFIMVVVGIVKLIFGRQSQ